MALLLRFERLEVDDFQDSLCNTGQRVHVGDKQHGEKTGAAVVYNRGCTDVVKLCHQSFKYQHIVFVPLPSSTGFCIEGFDLS